MTTAKQLSARAIVRVAVFVAKVGIAALLVRWLCSQRRFNLSLIMQVHPTVQTIALFSAAAVAVLVGLLIMSWRFELLLRRVDFSITYREAVGLTFIGSFIGSVLPGLFFIQLIASLSCSAI